MKRAQQAASVLHRPVEDILAQTLAAALPSLEDVPSDMRKQLEEMTWLDERALWKITRSAMSKSAQEQMHYLSELQGQRPLTVEEQRLLEGLRSEYGRITLRKARAFAVLSMRSGSPLLAAS
jgi:hypothetical protein